MQGIDGVLADELGDTASVVSDVRIGGAISRSGQQALPGADDASATQWAQLAAEQTARLQQNTTVVSIGANEGFPMTVPDGAACSAASGLCERVQPPARLILQSSRADLKRVLWLTLTLPRDERRLVITRGVRIDPRPRRGLASVTVLLMARHPSPRTLPPNIRHRGRDFTARRRRHPSERRRHTISATSLRIAAHTLTSGWRSYRGADMSVASWTLLTIVRRPRDQDVYAAESLDGVSMLTRSSTRRGKPSIALSSAPASPADREGGGGAWRRRSPMSSVQFAGAPATLSFVRLRCSR